jgi:hypothetical protein
VNKNCSRCKIKKSIDDFHKNKNCKDGRASRCKLCAKQAYENNKEHILEQQKEYYSLNKERVLAKNTRWQKENRGRMNEILLDYQKRNPEVYRANSAKRHARKLNATPKWANQDRIKNIYFEAQRMQLETGEKYDVDHIVPLQGENVCGLHVENNLRIILAKDNRSKHNKFAN